MSSHSIAADLFTLQRGRCAGCRRSLASCGFHQDHIVPRALGGTDGRRNRQLLCAACNLAKGARHPAVFYRSLGYLL